MLLVGCRLWFLAGWFLFRLGLVWRLRVFGLLSGLGEEVDGV